MSRQPRQPLSMPLPQHSAGGTQGRWLGQVVREYLAIMPCQHFLEEYSHNAAPEVFLAAAAGRTRQIHVGHGVVLSPPGYNPPARVAERIAMLDLVSSGRAEWGTGSSASRAELEGFNIDPAQKKLMWAEATEQTANMMAMVPYPGFQGEFFSMPARNVIPKSLQKPHPPIWLACSNKETIHLAARHSVGALAFAFGDPV